VHLSDRREQGHGEPPQLAGARCPGRCRAGSPRLAGLIIDGDLGEALRVVGMSVTTYGDVAAAMVSTEARAARDDRADAVSTKRCATALGSVGTTRLADRRTLGPAVPPLTMSASPPGEGGTP
jgi:hypothetical protein